jgi:hypothetical protein
MSVENKARRAWANAFLRSSFRIIDLQPTVPLSFQLRCQSHIDALGIDVWMPQFDPLKTLYLIPLPVTATSAPSQRIASGIITVTILSLGSGAIPKCWPLSRHPGELRTWALSSVVSQPVSVESSIGSNCLSR